MRALFGDVCACWWLGLVLSPFIYTVFHPTIARKWARLSGKKQKKIQHTLQILAVLLFAGVCWSRSG